MSSPAQPATSSRSVGTQTLAEGVVVLLVLTVVQRLVGLVRGVLFCRWLDPEQLGQWDLALSFMILASPLAVLGLPGSFGRYVETYRSQGTLRTFLRRTSLAALLPAMVFCGALAVAAPWTADMLFGTPDEAPLVRAMALALIGFILFNYVTSLFMALRSTRIVSYLQFVNTLLFAGLGLALLTGRAADAQSAVTAFGAACLISVVAGLIWIVRLWRELPKDEPSLAHGTLWNKLLPFAFWVWVTNWLSNSFDMADRYMIVHFGGFASHEALALVGQYHSARVIPALLLGLADLLGALATPHLAKDWEAGRRDAVDARLRMILKLFALVFTLGSAVVIVASPLFFQTALRDKFGFGEAIFPALSACTIWTGMAWISHNWLWCAERSRLVCCGLTIGLVVNVALNFVLLPQFGLNGAVAASVVARVMMLGVVWTVCRELGFRIDRGLLIVGALPGLLIIGPWPTVVVIALAASGLVPALAIFNAAEREELAKAARTTLARRFGITWPRMREPAAYSTPVASDAANRSL